MIVNLKGPILVGVVALLAVAAGLALAANALAEGRREARSAEFQRLVRGVGFGPAVDLGGCAFSFDPRICPDCPVNHGPVPGGVYFCPQHGCSIFYYPPLHSEERQADKETRRQADRKTEAQQNAGAP